MPSIYPLSIDAFTTKINHSDTVQGDIVYAEHINNLQDSVVAIESVLGSGINGAFPTVRARIESIANNTGSKSYSITKTCIYNGNPLLVNGANNSVLDAVNIFSVFTNVILPESLNSTGFPQHDALIDLVTSATSPKFFGTVAVVSDGSGGVSNTTIQSIQRWMAIGVTGIYVTGLGHSFGFNRDTQNTLIDQIHSYNLSVITSDGILDILDDRVTVNNPAGDTIHLDQRDIYLLLSLNNDSQYLFDNFKDSEGEGLTESAGQIYGTVNTSNWIRNKAFEFEVHAIVYGDQSDYYYYLALANILGFDGVCVQNNNTTSNTIDISPYVPLLLNILASAKDIDYDGEIVSRDSNIGYIEADVTNRTFDFISYKIPNQIIDFGGANILITSDMIRDVIIDGINAYAGASKINVNKIASYASGDYLGLYAGVEGSLNYIASTEPLTVQGSIVDILLEDNGGTTGIAVLVSDLLQNMPAEISVDLVNAINLSAGTAYINTALINNIDAGAIQTGTLDANRLAADSISANKLQVGTLSGRDIWLVSVLPDYVKESGGVVQVAAPSDIYGKTGFILNSVEVIEPQLSGSKVTFDISSLVGYVSGSETPHSVLLETYLILDSQIAQTFNITMQAQGTCGVYLDGVLVGSTGSRTSGSDLSASFVISLGWTPAGTHKLSIVYQYIHKISNPSNVQLWSKLARDTNGEYPLDCFNRVDCYAMSMTSIEGNRIITHSINVDALAAGTIDTDLITIQNLSDSNNYTRIFEDGLETYVGGTKRIVLGKIDSDYGFALLDSSGAVVMRTDTSGDLFLQKYLVVGNNVGLSGEGTAGADTRIWAGSSYINRDNAPFKVTQDGYLYAANAFISGVLKAVTFKYDELTVNSGSMMVIESDYIIDACTVNAVGVDTTITCSRNSVFSVNDIVRIKDGLNADSWLKITAVNNNIYTARLQNGSSGVTYIEKSAVVNYGQSGAGHVLIHSADNGSNDKTYIDINETGGASPWAGHSLSAISITNIVSNGNFADGATGWSGTYGSVSASNNILSSVGDGTNQLPRAQYNYSFVSGRKYYVRCRVRVTNSSCNQIQFNTASRDIRSVIASPTINTYYNLSGVFTSDGTDGSIRIRHRYADASTANGKVLEIDGTYGVTCIDLTTTYGAGNEPTVATVDSIIDSAGWWSGTKQYNGGLVRRVRIGDLSDIIDTDIQPTALSGWGLYSDNVYIKGILKGPKLSIDSINGTLRLGYTDEDYNLNFDGSNLLLGNGSIMMDVAGDAYFGMTSDNQLKIINGILYLPQINIGGNESNTGSITFYTNEDVGEGVYEDVVNMSLTQTGIIIKNGGFISVGNDEDNLVGISGEGAEQTSIRIWAGATHDNYASAPFHVQQNGFVQMLNANITGTIRSSVFDYGNASAIAGRLLLTDAVTLGKDVTFTGIENTDITLNTDDQTAIRMFALDEVFTMQGTDDIVYWFKVAVAATTNTVTVIPIGYTSANELPTFNAGTVIIKYGKDSIKTSLKIVGSDTVTSRSYIDIFSATQLGNGRYDVENTTTKLRIGDLTGVYDEEFTLQPHGFGLYADNVFIKGVIFSDNAVITNSTFTGNLYTGTLDTDNIIIADRRVKIGDSDDWKFIVHPDVPAHIIGADTDTIADPDTDKITIDHHWLTDGMAVTVIAGTGVIPGGLAAETTYYVIDATVNTFRLSATYAGSPIDITSEGTLGWHVFIEAHMLADRSAYKFLMSEQGVFNRNYDWFFYNTDGDALADLTGSINNITTSTAFAKIDNVNRSIISNRISAFSLSESNNMYHAELYKNALRLYYESQPAGNINTYNNSFNARFAIGTDANKNMIASSANVPIVIGALSESSEWTDVAVATKIKVGINAVPSTHELQVSDTLGVESSIFFTNSGDDKIKIVKRDAGSGNFTLDFYII